MPQTDRPAPLPSPRRRDSVALRIWLAAARRPPVGERAAVRLPDRPTGPVLWLHAEREDTGRALVHLAARIRLQHPEMTVMGSGTAHGPGVRPLSLPDDHPTACEPFAAALRPDVTLWTGQTLRPALLHAMRRTGGLMLAIDMRKPPFPGSGRRWLPDPSGAVLSLFDRVFAADDDALRALRRLGLDEGRIAAVGPLRDAGPPSDPDAAAPEPAELLAGRPTWLAARICAAEAEPVLHAHRRTVRFAHRLLLIAVPADDAAAAAIRTAGDALNLRLCNWDDGDVPDENTQVLATDGPEVLDDWYRLAPLAFLGGSLFPGREAADPLAAAAQGTAILYGPNVRAHLAAYSHLVEAGAARIVRDSESLSAAVTNLIAPEQAAAMAMAGWDVISQGAALSDAVLAEISARLSPREAG